MPSEFETVITDQTEYGTIITTQGAAIIADCILNGKKLPIVEAAAGDGGGEATTPTPGQTALVNERWRGEIAGKSLSPTTPNMIDVKVVIEDSVGGFTIREMGLYSDTGVLIAVCNTPATEKVSISGGVSGKLTMLMHIVVADASVLDFIINPSLDTVNRQELEDALEAHNEDLEAHPDIREDIQINAEAIVEIGKTANAAKTTAEKALEAAEAAAKEVSTLTHTISVVPSQSGSLTYNGAEQSPVWNNYSPETLAISGDVKKTAAGTYTAIFTPKGEYVWSDGTNTPKEVTWTIGRAVVNLPTQNGSLTYTGAAQSPTWSGYDSAKMTLGGVTSGTDVGSYSATFTPKGNYQWADGSTAARTVPWSIGKATVAPPQQSGNLTYTGSAQTPVWTGYDAAKLTMGGTTSGTNAGTYTATFTPTGNYAWADGSTGAKSVTWTISKAAGSLTLSKSSLTLNAATLSATFTVTRLGDGAINVTSSATNVATVTLSGNTVTVTAKGKGSATITVSVGAGTNHSAPANKTCSVTVTLPTTTLKDNSWATVRQASDAGNGANYWAVGDTKPVTINGKVGNFTFSNFTVDAFILGFNHNASREGSNRIHFQIGKVGGKLVGLCDSQYNNEQTSAGYFHMNTSRTNVGGWNASAMRKTLLGNTGTPTSPPANSLLAALPSDLRSNMKATTKYTDNTAGTNYNVASNVTATTDYLFLLAEFEVFGTRYAANEAEKNYQLQYDYYKAGNSKIHYKHDATGTAVWAWLRSPYYNNFYNFCGIYTSGSYNSNGASWSAAVAPGFSV